MPLRSVLLASALFCVFAAGATGTGAQEQQEVTAVVELFTSQGCSSCPPADAVLTRLARRSDVLALAYHVDYWNYLGWEDTLSTPENTARQYAYASAQERNSVYTPQAVLNGRDHVNGSKAAAIDQRLAAFAREGKGMTVDVGLAHEGDTLTIDVAEDPTSESRKANLTLVVFDRESTVDITRGENNGRTMRYSNSVRSFQTVGMWKGEAMQVSLPSSLVEDWSRQGCAVLLQATSGSKDNPGPVLGAAVIR